MKRIDLAPPTTVSPASRPASPARADRVIVPGPERPRADTYEAGTAALLPDARAGALDTLDASSKPAKVRAGMAVSVISPTTQRRRRLLLTQLQSHASSADLALGGYTLAQAWRERGPLRVGTEIYTPENTPFVERLRDHVARLRTAEPSVQFDAAALRSVVDTRSAPPSGVFGFLWRRPDIQARVMKVHQLAEQALEQGCPQSVVLELLSRFTALASLPFKMSMGNGATTQSQWPRGIKATAEDREYAMADRLLHRIVHREPALGAALADDTLLKYLEANRGIEPLAFEPELDGRRHRAVLIDGIVDGYTLARFYHHGVAPIGVFETNTVSYDGLTWTNEAGSMHDLAHWQVVANKRPYTETMSNFTTGKVDNEILFLVVDRVRTTLEPGTRGWLDDLIFRRIHEEGRPLATFFDEVRALAPEAFAQVLTSENLAQEVDAIVRDYRTFFDGLGAT